MNRYQHHFDQISVVQLYEKFASAIIRVALFFDNFRQDNFASGLQLIAQRLVEAGHTGEIVDFLLIDPLEELFGAKRLLPHLRHQHFHLGERHTEKVGA